MTFKIMFVFLSMRKTRASIRLSIMQFFSQHVLFLIRFFTFQVFRKCNFYEVTGVKDKLM